MAAFNRVNWWGLISLAAVLLLWEVSSRSSAVLRLYFPPLSEISLSLIQAILARDLLVHLWASVGRFFAGYLLAAFIAVTLGIVLGYFRWAYHLLEVVIEFLRPMPSVAMIPVAILLLGIGDPMIVAVTVYAATWPILINTIDGVRSIEPTLIHTGRTFGLGGWQILRRIILPASLPYVMTGLRISLAIALILVTTAEMIVGGKGLGFFILDEERSLRTSNMYAGIAVVAILGYSLNRLFVSLERQIMAWHAGMTARGPG
jgi:ABC-type nitrate/sulfonate/bicarbonate transport system permease component